jgi:glucose-1-phosphate thymidylyltransferase
MKGIVLAGGTGSRLWPLTLGTSKQLMPIYDKPLIYYPISTLMLSGIRDILIITTPHESGQFQRLLGDGSQWGVRFSFEVQMEPNGIAESFKIGEAFIGEDPVALILGDNIFYGSGLGTALSHELGGFGAAIFGYKVSNPSDFGVIELGADGSVIGLAEKPAKPRSNLVVPGLYFFDNTVVDKAKILLPSQRNEIEIVDLLNLYLHESLLSVRLLPDSTTWLDTGTIDGLHSAQVFVKNIETSLGSKILVPEEIAWRLGYISDSELKKLGERYMKSGYGKYLLGLLNQI